MKTSIKTLLFLIINLYSVMLIAGDKNASASKEAKARQWMKNQARYFIENKGQIANSDGKAADNVLFKANFGNCDIYLTTEGISYVFLKLSEVKSRERSNSGLSEVKSRERSNSGTEVEQSEIPKAERFGNGKPKFDERESAKNHIISYYRMDMKLLGAVINKDSIIKEQQGNQGHYNYFYPHCPDGIYNVNEYGKITIKSIYQGIDWIIYTNTKSESHPLKYDFIIHPQADYRQIKIKYINAQDVYPSIDKSKLNIKTIAGNIEEGRLYCYHPESKAETKSSYYISSDTVVSFQLAPYDKSQTMIIDPLVWATYYGAYGIYEKFTAVKTDSYDNVFICGYTASLAFPLQQLTGAYFQDSNVFWEDAVILKFTNYGVRLWATYYGGNGEDEASSLGIDNLDNVYIAGTTESLNFPVYQMPGAFFQDSLKISTYTRIDAFILKFNNQGQRLWATFYGGTKTENGIDLCIDSQNNLYILGNTNSEDFPVQQLSNAYWQANLASLFVDIFIIKFNNNGQRLWATYYGGSDSEYNPKASIDHSNNLFITGTAGTFNFPVQQMNNAYWQPNSAGDYDIFILKFNNQGVRKWATYFGGLYSDASNSINIDSHDNIYITGCTYTYNFPVLNMNAAYMQNVNTDSYPIIFILKFNSWGERVWTTLYGGTGGEIYSNACIDKQDNLYISGVTSSVDFPTQQMADEYWQPNFYYYRGIFILKFNKYGQRRWATYYGSHGMADDSKAICSNSKNEIYVVGSVSGNNAYTVDYGNGAHYDTVNDSNDFLILKFGICHAESSDSAKVSRNNFCASDNGNIKLIALGGVGDTLKWYKDGCRQNYIGSGDTLIIPSPTVTTTYYALWKSCDTTYSPCVSVTVTVDTATTRKPVLLSSSKNNFCSNDSSIIKLTAIGGSGDTLKWYAGSCGQNYLGNGDSIFIASPLQTTTYYARWESRCDTSACNSVIVNVKPMPVIDLGADAFICEGQSINLTVNQSNATFLWQDGSINNYFNVVKPGIYWVNVNKNNCYASDTIQFILCEPPLNIWIPNAFTPNGDGINDVFKIETINKIQEFRMLIFNRWGQLIFESNNPHKGWDGKCDGTTVQEGVYCWKMEYIWSDSFGISQKVEKEGIVTLVK